MRDIYAKRPHQEAIVFLMPVFSVRMIYAMADRLLQASLEAKAAKPVAGLATAPPVWYDAGEALRREVLREDSQVNKIKILLT